MRRSFRARADGAALIVLIALVGIAFTALLISAISGAGEAALQDQQTARALAMAREALIGYAVSVQPDTFAKRPGDLPCPDLDNDGDAEPTCTSASQRLGRLPFKTLELPELVDAGGERLWYALSSTFDRSTVNQCPTAGGPNCLNSDSRGTISVRGTNGALVHDGAAANAAIAVVFAPGPVLTRLGAGAPQDRGCTGDGNVAQCQQTGKCSDTSQTTARCNPANYLDLVGTPLPNEDNANFADSSSANGFIQGPVFDASGTLVLNDRLAVLRYADLMPRLEQRAAREALRCLRDYASANGGSYPWAAPVNADYTAYPLLDNDGTRFGRLPNQMPGVVSYHSMSPAWQPDCPITMTANKDKWWANWQNLVFYGVADGFSPDSFPPTCGAGCLVVNAPSAADKKAVVIVAGRALTGQGRGVGTPLFNYLEDANAIGSSPFKQAAASGTFDDLLLLLQ